MGRKAATVELAEQVARPSREASKVPAVKQLIRDAIEESSAESGEVQAGVTERNLWLVVIS